MNIVSIEECELLGDSKYRAYISQVEKALRNFESTSEWADLISALGKLNKVLMSHVKYAVIPKRVTIGKRLAQCLHPALPSGVHLKALETYDIIFKCVGTQRLAADLFTYSAGLFPLLAYAAMNVKPVLLALYETHFVSLGRYIKPGLTGLLLGLLPGLEEGSEHFDRTSKLLGDFCEATEPAFFYGCLWECVLTVPGVRLAAINFVVSNFNKKRSMEDQLYFMGTNIDVLVEAMCNSIQDTSVLVQRSALDLLLIGFPMHNSQLTRPDMAILATAAIKAVLRRDMSLNRRLYAWLLGTDASGNPLSVPASMMPVTARDRTDSTSTTSEPELAYFNTFSKTLLVSGIRTCIQEATKSDAVIDGKPANLRPFRILISLLDKPEIGAAILEDVLIDVFRHMYRECEALNTDSGEGTRTTSGALYEAVANLRIKKAKDPKQRKEEKVVTSEIIKTANLLFGAFEPYFMWDFLARTFEGVCRDTGSKDSGISKDINSTGAVPVTLTELCSLIEFLLDKVALETYTETQTQHLPELLRQITMALCTHCPRLSEDELVHGLRLCAKLLTRVLPSMTPLSGGTSDVDSRFSSPSRTFSKLASLDRYRNVNTFESDIDTETMMSESEVYVSADSDNDGGPESSSNSAAINNIMDAAKQETTSFSDFVQYDDNKSETFPTSKMSPNPSPKHEAKGSVANTSVTECSDLSAPEGIETLMQACVQCFQQFFCTLVRSWIVSDTDVSNMLATQIHMSPGTSLSSDLPRLQVPPPSPQHAHLYSMVNIIAGEVRYTEDCSTPGGQCEEVRVLPLDDLSPGLAQAFSCACQLLVDFSCFPMYCTNYHKVLFSSFRKEKDVAFPDWLQLLLTCACFVSNFPIQSAAISTLLDLISLTQSVITEAEIKEPDETDGDDSVSSPRSLSEGTVSVVIVPSFSPYHLKYLNTKTNFYRIVSTHLWNYLGEMTPVYHQRSVDLLYQLHQLAPTPWVCEDVIGNALLSDNKSIRLSAHKKFAVLWHLLREQQHSANPNVPPRMFDRSMFLMLDSLQSDVNPCRALTQTWLTHAIQRGDIARVLEPVLMMLLHPDTARISIQHVNIHEPRKVRISQSTMDTERAETKIYAISSEGGNIIYHVSNQGKPFSNRTSEELRTYALTTIAEGASGTKLARPRGDMDLPFERVSTSNLNLRVNPFGSESSLDKVIFDGYEPPPQVANIHNVKRLTAETCKKEGIYFDDLDDTEEAQEATEELSQKALEEQHPKDTQRVDDAQMSGEPEQTSKPHELEGSEHIVESEVGEAGCIEGVEKETPEEIVALVLSELIQQIVQEEEDSRVVLQVTRDADVDMQLGSSDNLKDSVSTENGSDSGQVRHRILSTQSKDSMNMSPEELLNAIDSKVSEADAFSEVDTDMEASKGSGEEIPGVHPLHTHILLYSQKYDAQRTLYALTCLKAIITSTPRLVTCAMATTSITNVRTPQHTRLQHLLARHRRSVFGKNFFSEIPGDALLGYRSSMYVEILISVSLYYIRSYYPNLMMSKLTESELNGNKEVQILSCEILTLLLSELVNVAKDSGKGFSTYIGDLLSRCKVQKALLHCLLASVYNARQKPANHSSSQNLTEAIISFNEENMDANTNETFQIKLLKLVLVLILLEDQIRKAKTETEGGTLLPPEWDKLRVNFQQTLTSVRYLQSRPIVYQGMMLSAILSALKQRHLSHMHRHWIAMVTSSLPYLNRALSHTVVTTVNQLCQNLEMLAGGYELGADHYSVIGTMPDKVPPDHLVTLLEGLTTICHYCILDASQQDITIGQHMPTSSNNIVNDTATAGQILSNLIHVFNPYSNNREPSPAKEVTNLVPPVMEARRNLLSILPRILASLTALWKAINISEAKHSSGQQQAWWTLGSPKTVRQYILEFVSPISRHHGVNMLGAVAVVWNDRRQRRPAGGKKVIPVACPDQLLLVELVGAIKVLPTDTLMQTVRQVIKQPPPTNLDKNRSQAEEGIQLIVQETVRGEGSENAAKRTPLEVSMLQFFYAYIKRTPGVQLLDSWPSFLALLRESLQLNLTPPGQFLLLVILNEFVQKIPQLDERKDQKDLQDIAQKLLEACGEIAGASLEQTTWLRRNLAVKPGPQVDVLETDDVAAEQDDGMPNPMETKLRTADVSHRQYSVQALVMLAEFIAPLLDVVYSSEEKDRVVPFLTSIMHRVFPYLRNHSQHNLPSFRACSQILASLSSYQYTRKSWRREGFDMLLDAAFFEMDSVCITYWHTVIDNLMTHDKVTFKDLLARVTVAPSSMNLFSSRDQEFENRAQLLKRFSFTIFCSELDQYQRFMPDIQERLSESLRVPSVPSVQAQVFYCFRVLVLRMSPQHLTSFWPTVITELVHVLLQVEQELIPDVEETSAKQKNKNRAHLARMANLDTSWVLGNGLCATNSNPSWLHLYLAACKLLDLALVLPTEVLPQFQLYRWAFTGDPGSEESDKGDKKRMFTEPPGFIPHVVRINRLMTLRFGPPPTMERVPGRPILTVQHLRSVQDLHPFFNTITTNAQAANSFATNSQTETNGTLNPAADSLMLKSKSAPEFRSLNLDSDLRPAGQRSVVGSGSSFGPESVSTMSPRQYIENMVETDFLDPAVRTT